MKIREDFISNSSSTSFIMRTSTTNKIAEVMLNRICQDQLDGYDLDKKARKDQENTFKQYSKNLVEAPADSPIMLPSCNYDTYICRLPNGSVYVTTCNNHSWDKLEDLGPVEQAGNGVDGDSELEMFANTLFYFDVRDRSIHTRSIWLPQDIRCSGCHGICFKSYLTNKLVFKCGHCLREDIGGFEDTIEDEIPKEDSDQ